MTGNSIEAGAPSEVSSRLAETPGDETRAGDSVHIAASCWVCCPSRKVCRREAGYSRETILLGCLGLMVVMLAATAFVGRMYRKQVHVLADEWFAKGEAAFRARDAEEAVKDYRNALVYSPGNAVFQLHLAQALTAAHKDEEARSYLLNLLVESPGSGEINLELARISARSNKKTSTEDPTQETMRYYYGAIYGVWDSNPMQMRWNAHRELCEYLLVHGMTDQAQAEIISLSQDVPPGDIARQKQAAELLMSVKLWNRALEEYRAILVIHKHDQDALAGAGVASFQSGQYASAIRYFEQLAPEDRGNPGISTMFATAREVQAANPFLPGLSDEERARRAVQGLARAETLLHDCSQRQSPKTAQSAFANSGLQSLQKLQVRYDQNAAKWSARGLARDRQAVDIAMIWVFQVEDTAAEVCGTSQSPADRVLLLIAQSRPSSIS